MCSKESYVRKYTALGRIHKHKSKPVISETRGSCPGTRRAGGKGLKEATGDGTDKGQVTGPFCHATSVSGDRPLYTGLRVRAHVSPGTC